MATPLIQLIVFEEAEQGRVREVALVDTGMGEEDVRVVAGGLDNGRSRMEYSEFEEAYAVSHPDVVEAVREKLDAVSLKSKTRKNSQKLPTVRVTITVALE